MRLTTKLALALRRERRDNERAALAPGRDNQAALALLARWQRLWSAEQYLRERHAR